MIRYSTIVETCKSFYEARTLYRMLCEAFGPSALVHIFDPTEYGVWAVGLSVPVKA